MAAPEADHAGHPLHPQLKSEVSGRPRSFQQAKCVDWSLLLLVHPHVRHGREQRGELCCPPPHRPRDTAYPPHNGLPRSLSLPISPTCCHCLSLRVSLSLRLGVFQSLPVSLVSGADSPADRLHQVFIQPNSSSSANCHTDPNHSDITVLFSVQIEM
ncbi:unnamed protein product [Pleuronectes platessa]|uniref:Uncharacterized protein n=1 Tax=Pleuronectes platessa TaxID=8262 RepID=A0A9N7THD4_PLEPL|nr:unnamed protein product [Pleuronectes platessa]